MLNIPILRYTVVCSFSYTATKTEETENSSPKETPEGEGEGREEGLGRWEGSMGWGEEKVDA